MEDLFTNDNDDDLLRAAIRHPFKYNLHHQLLKKVESHLDGFFSKDSTDFKYIFSKNGLIQERPFHKEFPKKASNLDLEELYVDMNSDFVARWIPRDVARMIFPALYFSDMVEQLKRDRSKGIVEFIGGQVPTLAEKERCQQLRGKGMWSRSGIWFCSCKNANTLAKDGFGPRFFESYNQWLKWDRQMVRQEMSARAKIEMALEQQDSADSTVVDAGRTAELEAKKELELIIKSRKF